MGILSRIITSLFTAVGKSVVDWLEQRRKEKMIAKEALQRAKLKGQEDALRKLEKRNKIISHRSNGDVDRLRDPSKRQ